MKLTNLLNEASGKILSNKEAADILRDKIKDLGFGNQNVKEFQVMQVRGGTSTGTVPTTFKVKPATLGIFGLFFGTIEITVQYAVGDTMNGDYTIIKLILLAQYNHPDGGSNGKRIIYVYHSKTGKWELN